MIDGGLVTYVVGVNERHELQRVFWGGRWWRDDDLRAARATERDGRVWFGALAWSGRWRIAIEQTPQQQVRVTGGYNTTTDDSPTAWRRSLPMCGSQRA